MSEDTYPGSKRKINAPKKEAKGPEEWELNPRILKVNGKDVEFYTIGQLAAAINRRPVTLRKWESNGWLPKPIFRAPSDDIRGKRRLYTRSQILGIVRIAKEEGIFDNPRMHVAKTDFTAKVEHLFKTLGLAEAS